jgi:hypothetical protein
VVGETFQAIIARQFHALRAGDRYFWANQNFDSDSAARIAQTTLSQVIKRNTDTLRVPLNVFVAEGDGKTKHRNPRAPGGPIDNHGRLGVPFILP